MSLVETKFYGMLTNAKAAKDMYKILKTQYNQDNVTWR